MTADSEKKNKWLYPTVITLLVLMFLSLITYGVLLVSNISVSYIEPALTEAATPVPENAGELAKYLEELTAKVAVNRPLASYSWSADGESVNVGGGDLLADTVSMVKGKAMDYLGELDESKSVGYGGDPSVIPLPSGITADDILSFDCKYIYYECPACHTRSDDRLPNCAACGYEAEYMEHYTDSYSFTAELRASQELESRLFPVSARQMEERLALGAQDWCSFDNASQETTGLVLTFESTRADDRLISLNVIRTSVIRADLGFTGSFASLGSCPLEVSLRDTAAFSFGYPSIRLSRSALSLKPKEKEQIVAERICDDPQSYTVKWESSDENIASVDQKGYIKAGREPGTATVTASFEYQGKTYSAQCEVKVKISVDYISVSRRSLKLSPGETFTLSARVASDKKGFAFKKPTIQTVTWHSEDESVATVDENGVVTAVSPGKTEIYALSDDASLDGYYYRSACAVTVG